ncbi:MAG: GspE/PulE family protein [Gaiellaceae bacterium MAG52_C11]|nr:GspE/PulE family protein [Candidatus Gaiellasilicea maunaloa]
MRLPKLKVDSPELRLVDDPLGAPADPAGPDDEARGHGELVSEVIAEAGLLAPDKLEEARTLSADGSFSQALIDVGVASGLGVARTLADQYHLPLVDLAVAGVDSEASKSIALPVLERVCAIPFAAEGANLKLAITDPQNVQGLDELRLATRRPIEFFVAARNDVLTELRRLSRASEALNAAFITDALDADGAGDEDDLEADDGISDAPLVRLVNSIIFQAAEDGASDIHVEPQEDELVVRYRIDGVLKVAQRIPKRLTAGATTRLKVLAKLDIAERRKPQDGRITMTAATAGRMLDIRVATLPTVEGETVTMRLLDKSREVPTLESLGLSEEMREQLGRIVSRPTGALLVTGPTGSGKSTTLYAALLEINRPEINIITVEDPVEYRVGGIKQVQINPRAGLTFATALRSILRSDPDVVMVGEVRDGETARISIEAALTGHFVLSTLHTNDAPSALTRLNEMGVEPFITGAAVSAVLAQRLARKLCAQCAVEYEPSPEELRALHVDEETVAGLTGATFRRRVGCPRCGNTGYRGRIGVFQLLEMTSRLEQLASENASREEIERAAHAEGMRSLWHDGVAKVAAGITTVEELARVCTV